MSRRRKKDDDDEPLTFDEEDDSEEEEEEEEESVVRRRYARPVQFTMFESDEDSENDLDRFDDLEPEIRAGNYKPKRSDPYTAHVLYNNLIDLGKIKAI